jgi:DNA polymerase-3 subunit alpha
MKFIKVDKVEDVKYTGDVYDLNVEEDHNYTINNYSVHNSGGSSLLCYLIAITNVNPILHDLDFSRFLDPSRLDMPDLDIDFSPRHADEIFEYIVNRFGRDNVTNIGTYGMLKTKSAIQDVARVFGILPSETNIVTKNIDIESEGDTLEEHEKANPELTKYLNKNVIGSGDLRFFIEGVRGSARNLSMHAAGVLISNVNLKENLALMKCKKGIITAWQESGSVQELSTIGYCIEENTLIKTNYGDVPIKDIDGYKIQYLDNNGEIQYLNEEDYILIETGKKELMEFILEDGSKILCSKDHKLFKKI